jgi:hypothetical protein
VVTDVDQECATFVEVGYISVECKVIESLLQKFSFPFGGDY